MSRRSQFALVLPVVAAACFFGFDVGRDELRRALSADGRREAVLVRTNCGATCSYGYHVFVVGAGDSTEAYESVFHADHVDSLAFHWQRSEVLEISFRHARIFRFTNFTRPRNE